MLPILCSVKHPMLLLKLLMRLPFVHVFSLILIITIRCRVHYQHEQCLIFLQILEWNNFSCFIGSLNVFLVLGSCISICLVYILNHLVTTQCFLVPSNLPWFLLSPAILILQVSFASGWLVPHHLIEQFQNSLCNWTLIAVLLPLWIFLEMDTEALGSKCW